MRQYATSIVFSTMMALCSSDMDAATFWVSSDSTSASPCTQAQPCQPAAVLNSELSAGDVVIFSSGVYTGANYMVQLPSQSPPSGITIQCEEDGECLLDAEFVDDRLAILLRGNDNTIEGFNACCTFGTAVVRTVGQRNIVRRVVAWDADLESPVMQINGDEALFEDVAAYGTGRKMVSFGNADSEYEGGTARRAWARWEGSNALGPKMAITLFYDVVDTTCENCIATWNNGSMPDTYVTFSGSGQCASGFASETGTEFEGCDVANAYGLISRDRCDREDCEDTDGVDAAALGSMAYLRGASTPPFNCFNPLTPTSGSERTRGALDVEGGSNPEDGILLRDIAVAVDVENELWSSLSSGVPPLRTGPGLTPLGLNLEDATSLGALDDDIDGDWSQSNVEHEEVHTDLSDTVYDGSGGSSICFEYQNRTETTNELWPWPMRDRILRSFTKTKYGAADYDNAPASTGHSHEWIDCPTQDGGCCSRVTVERPHVTADVMDDVMTMFGVPPNDCIRGNAPPAGRLPDGGAQAGDPLTVDDGTGSDIVLAWGDSCTISDDDFEVYQASLDTPTEYEQVACTTGGNASIELEPAAGDVLYLVVPGNGTWEGSYGVDSAGGQRLPSQTPCRTQFMNPCAQ